MWFGEVILWFRQADRKAKGICHRCREENYETSRAINCLRETSFRRKPGIDAEKRGERWKRNQTGASGDHLKLSIPTDQRQIISVKDH